MASCALEPCGRKDLDGPAPGLELWEGKWSCTLCYVNPLRFPQPKRKKKAGYEQPDPVEPGLKPADKMDLFSLEEE